MEKIKKGQKKFSGNRRHLNLLLKAIEKEDIDIWNKWREKNIKKNVNLKGASLSKANLKGVNLIRANLSRANLNRANLSGAILNSSVLTKAYLKGANLKGTQLVEVTLTHAKLVKANLDRANLVGSDLSGADLSEASLKKANLWGTDLWRANLGGANLSGANLEGANLTSCILTQSCLNNAILSGAQICKWIIIDCSVKGIKCNYIYIDDSGKERFPKDSNFEEGEFEKLFSMLKDSRYQLHKETRARKSLDEKDDPFNYQPDETIRSLPSPESHRWEESIQIMHKIWSRLERPKFTFDYPEIIETHKWYSLFLFVYMWKYEKVIQQEITTLKQKFELPYEDFTSQFPGILTEGCNIIVVLSSDTIQINPEVISIKWLEDYYKYQFRIRYTDKISHKAIHKINADIFVDDMLVAGIQLPVTIDKKVDSSKDNLTVDAKWFDEVFASYARKDYTIVESLKERYKDMGIDMFIDIENLRSGVNKQKDLFNKIKTSDIFQLFWSHSSKRSKNVRDEWEKAFEIASGKNNGFVRPVYWEEPMPKIPPQLSHIHFHKLSFLQNKTHL